MKDCYPKRAENVASRILNGEAIIMDPADSTLFNLNETATAIWRAADGSLSLAEIVEREVCGQFEVEPGEAMREATEFVEALAAHSILVLSPEPV